MEVVQTASFDTLVWMALTEVKKNVRCLSRQIATALVKDNRILVYGWNGPPEALPPCNIGWYKDMTGKDITICPRYDMGFSSGKGLEYCIAIHAERSAILRAAARGIPTKGLTLYMTCSVPCKDCLVEILEAQIAEIVVTDVGEFYDEQSKYIMSDPTVRAKLKMREWDFHAE